MLSMQSDKLILSAFPRGHKNIPRGMGREPAHTLWSLSHCSLSSLVLVDEISSELSFSPISSALQVSLRYQLDCLMLPPFGC